MSAVPVVHFKTVEGTACQQQRDRRWSSKQLTSTKNWAGVTCAHCRRKQPK